MSYSEIADAINEKFGTCYTRSATIGRGRRMGGLAFRSVRMTPAEAAIAEQSAEAREGGPTDSMRAAPGKTLRKTDGS
jgi:GcrA cell cycle regulator